MNEGLMNIAGNQQGGILQLQKYADIRAIQNGLVVSYNGKSYYCKTVAQVSKLLKEIFPDE